MNGYIMNTSSTWAHAMKRSIRPGQKIPLNEIYDQYGEKHGLEKGVEFVEWLKSIKLSDKNVWAIVLEDEKMEAAIEKEIRTITTADKISPKKMTVENVTALSVRKAREVLPEISDIKLLRYAIQEANKLSNKDSLCRLIRKRIGELEVAGFH